MTAAFDWAGFERTLTDGLTEAIRAFAAARPGERCYAAVLDRVHRETDGIVALPLLYMNTEEALAAEDLRWSPGDWVHADEPWLPDEVALRWEQALTAYACRGTTRQWSATVRHYFATLVRVCRKARTASGVLVLVMDDAGDEALIRRVLSPAEVGHHFPEFDADAAERARVAALPVQERVAYHIQTFDGSALTALGPAAIPALTALLGVKDEAWRAAKVLADIGVADPAVVEALDKALTRRRGADRAWVARALSRLGRLDLVLARDLPDVVATAVAAPYTSFRDHGAAPSPLDYRQLEDVLRRLPMYEAALAEELAPGRGFCEITAAEVPAAVGGLRSEHPVVRRHAACVLGDRHLGRAAGRVIVPALRTTAEADPDPDVRRLAALALDSWRA